MPLRAARRISPARRGLDHAGELAACKSDDPHTFLSREPRPYEFPADGVNIGLAGEMIECQGKWYRSGFFGGGNNATRLGFTEIEWVSGGAFRVVRPSVME